MFSAVPMMRLNTVVLQQDERARLRDDEVCAADAHVRLAKLAPQVPAGDAGEGARQQRGGADLLVGQFLEVPHEQDFAINVGQSCNGLPDTPGQLALCDVLAWCRSACQQLLSQLHRRSVW